jgi:hypothetical protein
MTYDDRMRAILLADHERFMAREAIEDSRANIVHATNDRSYMRGIGLIPQNECERAYPNMPPRMRYTNAQKCEGTSPNIRVTDANGTSVVPASSFRRKGTTTSKVRVVAEQRQRAMTWNIASSQADYD